MLLPRHPDPLHDAAGLTLPAVRFYGGTSFFEGALVQLMQNDPEMMLQTARTQVATATSSRSDGATPFLRLYIDCAGRASIMSGSEVEEADVVRGALQDDVPFLGFYSGVEIAPMQGFSRPLDWTGVLMTLLVRAR